MSYTPQQILEVLNKYKNKIKIHKNIPYSGNIKENISLFNEINTLYPNMFKTIVEMIYLLNNDIKEKFCPDGNMLTFGGYKDGYSTYCKNGPICKQLRLKNWEDKFEEKHGVRKLSDLPMMKEKFADPEWGKMCRKHQLDTFQQRTGYDHPSHCPECIEKREQNNIKMIGVKHHWASKDPKLNGRAKRKELYGYENIWCTSKNKKKAADARKTEESKNKMRATIKKNKKKRFESKHEHFDDFNEEFFRKNFIINGRFDLKACCDYFKIFYSWANCKKREFKITEPNINYITKEQQQLYDYIRSIYSCKILYNKRTIIPPQELDIYLPDINLAIEFNGLYWHSNIYRENYYHQNKTLKCLQKDINLIHIYEDEWLKNQENIKKFLFDRIHNNFNINKNIYVNQFITLSLDKDEIIYYLKNGFQIVSINEPQKIIYDKFILYNAGTITLFLDQPLLQYIS